MVRAVGASENSKAALTSHKIGEMHTQDLHGDCRKEIQTTCQNPFSYNLGTSSSQTTNLRNKKAKLSKACRDKKNPSTSNSKTLKRSNPEPDTYFKPSALVSCPSSQGFSLPHLPSTSYGGVGNLAQEQDYSHPRANCSNPCSPNGHTGLVRRGPSGSLESHFSNHLDQCKNRESSLGSPSLGKDPKSKVEVSNRHVVNLRK